MGGPAVARSSAIWAFQLATVIILTVVAALAATGALAQPMPSGMNGGPMMGHPGDDGRPWPVYQRKGFHGGQYFGRPGFNNWYGGPYAQQFSGNYFTRPYPYHLDYYRMKYGGSYAPYYGNLYGQPNSVYPPQYNGDYGPNYYGPDGGGPNYGNGEQTMPSTSYPPSGPENTSGHWAWCWIPDQASATNTSEVVQPNGPAAATNSSPKLMPPQ
jgi:hypothetical protein